MHLRIQKETSPKALEEKISIYIEKSEVDKYVQLLKKTWPKTKIEEVRLYG